MQADVGSTITVNAQYNDDQSTAEDVTSAATAAVTNVNDAGSVAISGTATQGQTLTATVSDDDGVTGTITYQWKRGEADIIGANSATYVLVQADVGSTITVNAQYNDDQSTAEDVTSAATAAVTNVNDAGSVAISGTATQGQTLTATVSDDDGVTGTITYQWKRGEADIIGANSATYVLVQADVGSTITVNAQYNDDQSTAEDVTSAATAAVTNVNDAGSVAISGTATQGQTLTATVSDDDGVTGTITYQWKRGEADIIGANSATYVLVQADVGSTITVNAQYNDDQSTAEDVTSAATAR